MDSSGNRPVRDDGVGARSTLLRVGRCSGSADSGCTRSAMELSPGIRVSSSPSSHTEDLGLLRPLPPSDALLARPEMVPGGPGSPGHGRSSPSGHAGSDRPHVGPSFSHAGGLEASLSQMPPASFPAVGAPLQRLDTTPFGARSRTFSVPMEFSSSPSI